ncbi:MAG: RDD family protein [Fibrobacterales bacterium]
MKKTLAVFAFIFGFIYVMMPFTDMGSQANPNQAFEGVDKYFTIPLGIVSFILSYRLWNGENTKGKKTYLASTGRRVCAVLIDGFVFMIPFFLLQPLILNNVVRLYPVFQSFFWLLCLSLNIYLLTKFGASIGKMIMGLQVVKLDNNSIKFSNAMIRTSIDLSLAFITAFSTYLIFTDIDLYKFSELTFTERNIVIAQSRTMIMIVIGVFQTYWMCSEIIVMQLNKDRRAIHDFMAGTLVVNKKQLLLQDINK